MMQNGYTGVAFPFKFNGSGGVSSSSTNEYSFSHIREEIVQVLCTRVGERVQNPDFGSRLHEVIFDPNDITTTTELRTYAEEALKLLEDVIEIVDIDIEESEDDGVILINLDVFVKKYLKSESVVVPYKLGGVY